MSSGSRPEPPNPLSPEFLCAHNQNEEVCPFCTADRELEEHPGLLQAPVSAHEFGCPLFENPQWTFLQRENYERIYALSSECTCKKKEEDHA